MADRRKLYSLTELNSIQCKNCTAKQLKKPSPTNYKVYIYTTPTKHSYKTCSHTYNIVNIYKQSHGIPCMRMGLVVCECSHPKSYAYPYAYSVLLYTTRYIKIKYSTHVTIWKAISKNLGKYLCAMRMNKKALGFSKQSICIVKIQPKYYTYIRQ